MQNKTIYSNTSPKRILSPSIAENLECEIAIIGGGIAGLSLAYHLAKYGQNFILIESASIGDCASGINGGFCSPGWSIGLNELLKNFGRVAAKEFYELSVEGVEWVYSFKDKVEFKMMDLKDGIVGVSMLQSEQSGRELFFGRQSKFNNDSEFISKKELKNYVQSSLYQWGILHKSGFSFNPLNFLVGLKKMIDLKSPRAIYENSRMKSFVEDNESCHIELTNGSTIKARKLVIATGGYGGVETGFLKTRWLPIMTSIAVTSPFPKDIRKIINPNFAFSDDRRAGNYYRLLSDNRLLWGRGINAITSPNKSALKNATLKDLKMCFPTLADLKCSRQITIDFVWSGKMAYSKSMMPYVGRLTPRTYALTGFGGHGMNTAPAAAAVLAEELLGLSDRVSIFKKIPLKWNGSIFGPIGAEATYKIMAIKDYFSRFFLS